jgi:hypothetical protein
MDRTLPVRFFKGLEIEATNHFLLPTMIAPGQYDYQECKDMMIEHETNHILLGYMYNPAGDPLTIDLDKAFLLAHQLMADGYKVTLEIRPDQLTDEFVERCPDPDGSFGKLFVILIGTYFPNMPKIGPYTTLKLHSNFGNTQNNGVWCVKAEDFKKAGMFTPWAAYGNDIFIK